MSLQPAIPCTLPPLEAQLPVFPISFPVTFNATESSTPWTMAKINNTNTKLIPRNAFISFRNKPANSTELDDEILGFINTSTHEGWNVYMHGHQEQINFMERYYANTSLLWAIKLISPVAGASISDVWRVAVLYAFGGMYIDDDAWWSKSLESFVGSNDALIVATEPGPYRDDCYRGDFHLSKPILETKANRTIVYNDFWRGRRLAQFAFFSQPRHPVLGRFLINIVEQLRLEYMESSPVYRRGNDPRWKIIVCATGPDIWTTTMYEMMIEKDKGLIPDLNMRVIERAFEAQGCYFKIQEAKHVIARKSSHYYGMRESYLTSYHPTCPEQFNGRLVHHGQSGYFLVVNGTKRKFPSQQAFEALNLSVADSYVISNESNFEAIPLGEPFPEAVTLRRLVNVSSWIEYGSAMDQPRRDATRTSMTPTTDLYKTVLRYGYDILYRFAAAFWGQSK